MTRDSEAARTWCSALLGHRPGCTWGRSAASRASTHASGGSMNDQGQRSGPHLVQRPTPSSRQKCALLYQVVKAQAARRAKSLKAGWGLLLGSGLKAPGVGGHRSEERHVFKVLAGSPVGRSDRGAARRPQTPLMQNAFGFEVRPTRPPARMHLGPQRGIEVQHARQRRIDE